MTANTRKDDGPARGEVSWRAKTTSGLTLVCRVSPVESMWEVRVTYGDDDSPLYATVLPTIEQARELAKRWYATVTRQKPRS